MSKYLNNLKKLVDNVGLRETSKILGISILDLIDRLKMVITHRIVSYDILPELVREEIIPSKYKDCEISYSTFEGIVCWECYWRWGKSNTYATPFYDGQKEIPISTMEVLENNSNGFWTDIDENTTINKNIITEFKDLDELKEWLNTYYVESVYRVIKNQLKSNSELKNLKW